MTAATPVRVVSFCGSIRRGSFNEAVLSLAERMCREAGADIDSLRLDDFPMDLYNADDHRESGIPAETHALYARVTAADAVLIASPEYNGGYTPLLKNTIDWLSRIDKFVLYPRLVGLIAVTPGRMAGANVLAQTTGMLESMAIRVHEGLGIGQCREVVIDGVLEDEDQVDRLASWTSNFVKAVEMHAQDPPVPPT